MEQVDRNAAIVRAVFPESLDIDNLGRALAAMPLFDKRSSDGENEPHASKLFAALFRAAYIAHIEDSAFAYAHGAWSRINSLPCDDLEYATSSARSADGFFGVHRVDFQNTQRAATHLFPSMREIVTSRPMADIAPATSDLPTPTATWGADETGVA